MSTFLIPLKNAFTYRLKGAKAVGMKTVFTEALDVKYDKKRAQIMEYADYHIKEFKEISYLFS